jgi:peptidylprolyl isomerase
MIRLLAALAVLICAAPALAQQLPAGADPQNTLLIDTKHGRIVVKLRNDLAP